MGAELQGRMDLSYFLTCDLDELCERSRLYPQST